ALNVAHEHREQGSLVLWSNRILTSLEVGVQNRQVLRIELGLHGFCSDSDLVVAVRAAKVPQSMSNDIHVLREVLLREKRCAGTNGSISHMWVLESEPSCHVARVAASDR